MTPEEFDALEEDIKDAYREWEENEHGDDPNDEALLAFAAGVKWGRNNPASE